MSWEDARVQPAALPNLIENLIETALRAFPQPQGLAYLGLTLRSQNDVPAPPVLTAFPQAEQPIALQRAQIVSERRAIH